MGHTVGQVLINNGLEVFTCLAERSQRTRQLAEKVGITNLSSYDDLVQNADLILSILVPDRAIDAAYQVSKSIERTQAQI